MRVLEHDIDQRMPGFMPRGVFLLVVCHRQASAFSPPPHLVAGLFELRHAHRFLAGARRQQCRPGKARLAPTGAEEAEARGSPPAVGER
jgi:hypothetical protein